MQVSSMFIMNKNCLSAMFLILQMDYLFWVSRWDLFFFGGGAVRLLAIRHRPY